jgi:hypothetical protein
MAKERDGARKHDSNAKHKEVDSRNKLEPLHHENQKKPKKQHSSAQQERACVSKDNENGHQ